MAPPRLSQSPDRPVLLILQIAILFRLINVSCIRTFFQPDEFFQSLEPAWNLAFGPDSGAWITWEWKHQLRSSLHPIIFSLAYTLADAIARVLPFFASFRVTALLAAPRILQAVFAALGDWYTWQLATKIYPQDANVSMFALLLQFASPWQWYCSTRTFSNSLEMTLTVAALYYWPWQLLGSAQPVKENPQMANLSRHVWELRASLSLAAFAVILRPTNILIWLTIVFFTLTRLTFRGPSPLSPSDVLILLREGILCGSLVLAVSLISDYLYFGFWTFPTYNFLYFNISQSLAVFYGRNPWHYYILQGLPLLCTTSLPFAIRASYKPTAPTVAQQNVLKTFSYTAASTILALSLISHKEVRFIHPLLPILNLLSAPLAASFFTSSVSQRGSRSLSLRNKPYLVAALAINILLAGFLSFLHQPAPLTVLSFLRSEFERTHTTPSQKIPSDQHKDLFALFLMPCHSTPWRSHLIHSGLSAYALSCEPPLHTQPNTPERDNYRDEADRFYDDPIHFLSQELFAEDTGLPTPRYIVGFEGIEPWLQEFLETPRGKALAIKPRPVWSGFNGFFNEDWRRSGNMVVWETSNHNNHN
ncbi:family 22 glycosyltransferase [Stachybotrys elegans]|uniref:Mannosyltransferase n=1 Tax=Stachybotrys elegans TaxID=80388 RepID=A0A8K0SYM4_9HYPO|nr:family 22 glycosyltransferase [Stachybotrys elegans]